MTQRRASNVLWCCRDREATVKVGRAQAAVLAAITGLVLTGCSTVIAGQAPDAGISQSVAPVAHRDLVRCQPGDCPGGPPAGSRALCRDIPRMTELTVRRFNEFPQDDAHFTFPSDVVIDRQANVEDIARALCVLPRDTLVNCPADFGVSYILDFGPARLDLAQVGIDATGCRGVTGIGKPDRIATPQFWTVLGSAMGITMPGSAAVFSGGLQ